MILQTIMLTGGVLCLVAAVVLVFWPRWIAAVPAYAGLLLLHLSTYIALPLRTLIFWGIATAITAGLYYLTPSGEPDGNRSSNLYVGFSSLAGGMLGILLAPRILVLGVILGAAVGQLAYSRTPAGQWMHGRSKLFLRYFAAKCLPVIIAISIVCIAIMGRVID